MKIYFTRHGEAMDDIENRYGGWYNPDLSPAGIEGAKKSGERFAQMKVEPDLILTSPLKRAIQTAEGIAEALNVPIEEYVYLKERNTYGLLCGQNKEEAKKKYPELVKAYENSKEVLGYEPYDFFLKRVRKLIEKLAEREEEILICVTHGKLLKAIFNDILKIKAKKFYDNCIAEVELTEDGNLELINTKNVDLI